MDLLYTNQKKTETSERQQRGTGEREREREREEEEEEEEEESERVSERASECFDGRQSVIREMEREKSGCSGWVSGMV